MQSIVKPSVAPKVTVIIPTFNRDAFISDAIDSVLSQSFTDFELVVVDDGSTDKTANALSRYNDPRLVFLCQENKGRSNARNRALANARGQYIAFLDSDDLYLPEKLALQVAFFEDNPNVDMIYTSATCVNEDGVDLNFGYIASVSGRIYRQVAFFQPVTIALPTVMVRKSVFDRVGNFDERMSRFEDTDMWRRISKVCYVHGMTISTCKLRTHSGNTLSAQNPKSIMDAIDYYCAKIFREDSDQPYLVRKKGIARLYLYYGSAFMTVPGWESSGRALITTAFCHWPPYLLWSVWKLTGARLRRLFGKT